MAIGVPETDVFAAADAVLERGERPTVERVRQELGRGSPARVCSKENRRPRACDFLLGPRASLSPKQGKCLGNYLLYFLVKSQLIELIDV